VSQKLFKAITELLASSVRYKILTDEQLCHSKESRVLFTDVNNMSFAVKHYVAIMPIFELQQECQKTVASHADDEVSSCL